MLHIAKGHEYGLLFIARHCNKVIFIREIKFLRYWQPQGVWELSIDVHVFVIFQISGQGNSFWFVVQLKTKKFDLGYLSFQNLSYISSRFQFHSSQIPSECFAWLRARAESYFDAPNTQPCDIESSARVVVDIVQWILTIFFTYCNNKVRGQAKA